MKPKLVAPLLLTILLAACAASERHERTIWYIAPGGNDANVCTESTDACRTLAEVLDRVDQDDKIILAAGTYIEIVDDPNNFPAITDSLWITGAGVGETIIDMTRGSSLRIIGWGSYQLENFTIRNSPRNCIEINYRSRAAALMTSPPGFVAMIENVEATGCAFSGFFFAGDHGTGTGDDVTVTMANVVASSNRENGLTVVGADVTIRGGEASDNGDAGIVSTGGAAVSLTNGQISANDLGVLLYDNSTFFMQFGTIENHPHEGLRVATELAARAELDEITITNNCTITRGGRHACAIENIGGTIAIRNSLITNNPIGAIHNVNGEISIDQTTIEGNTGSIGTVHNEVGTMVIQNSLIANNTAPYALRNQADLSVLNSTVSGNSSVGVYVDREEIALSFVTIAENGGTGLALLLDGGIRRADNVLIVKNGSDCAGTHLVPTLRLGGANFDSDSTCPETFITRSPAAIQLDALADNGGLTFTHALLPGSPAIDAATSSCPAGDQRLVARPIGAACDVGAYEAGAAETSLEATPTPAEIVALVLEDARCRTGPGQVYPDFDFFEPGQTTVAKGRSADSNWYLVEAISYAGNCWIGKAVLQFDVSAEILLALPIINPPPTPTPTLDPDESYDITPTACPTLINKPGSCK